MQRVLVCRFYVAQIWDPKVYPLPRYLEIEPRYVTCTEDYLIMKPEKAIELMDENTIGVCAILGSTVSSWIVKKKSITG